MIFKSVSVIFEFKRNFYLALITAWVSMLSQAGFSNSLFSGPIIVNFNSPKHFNKQQFEKWPELCKVFAKKFEVGKGYWSTGLAEGSSCTLNKEFEKYFSKDSRNKHDKEYMRLDSIKKFILDVDITGEIPENNTSETDKNIVDRFIGAPMSLWDGFKRQLFKEEDNDNRIINFSLSYFHKGKKILLSNNSYNYHSRFIGFFELDGFSDLIAFNLLLDAPAQWDLKVLKYDKEDKIHTILIDKHLTNFTLDRNLVFVRPHIVDDKRIIVPFSEPIESNQIKDVNLNITESLTNPFIRYLSISAEKLPTYKGTYLSLGPSPVTRYYVKRRTDYLIRKLTEVDLTFYFASSTFGVSQILDSNDEISYVGFRVAKGFTNEKTLMDQYFNIDFSMNKGPIKGIKTSLNLWPKTKITENEIDKEIGLSRILFGYKFSLMLPLLGFVEVSPTLGLLNYEISASSNGIEKSASNSFVPSFGFEAGYRLNILDFLLYGYSRYTFGVFVEEDISSLEFGVDIGYKISNLYKMRTVDPAIYGFALWQSTEVTKPDSAIRGFKTEGLVLGVGGSVVWE